LLFTHSDYDHIIGYGAFPEATVIVSEAFENNPKKEKSLEGILKFDDEYYISRNYKIEYPKGDILVKKDRQQLQIGKTTLTFYLAPGHNPDGIFTIIEPLSIWIAGDYLSNEEFPYIYFSSYDYEKTLVKVDYILNKHNIKMLVPGHGDIAFDNVEIQKRKAENLQYIFDLREAVSAGKQFDLESLLKKYRFPGIMTQFHEGNIKLLKKEIEDKI
jgi:glyoxylase-like metal-dependent hydrolase (beta-lactamase superfamily II)